MITNTTAVEYWTNREGPLDEWKMIADEVAKLSIGDRNELLTNYHYNYWRLRRHIEVLEAQLNQ